MKGKISYHEKKIYERYAGQYWEETEDYTRFIEHDIDLFLDNLPGKKILDLGCGPGRDAHTFKERGYEPICLDIAESMAAICRKRDLKCIIGNFENLNFKPNTFDGIWSYTSLTTNSKRNFERVIKNCWKLLRESGILFLGLIKGEGERWKSPDEKYDLKRYTSRYDFKEAVQRVESKDLELIFFRKISSEKTGRNTYLNFMFKK